MFDVSLLFRDISAYVMGDPVLRLTQGGLILLAFVVLYLLFYALRDVLLRTHSFLYQFFCILLVALLPVIGFLLYLLIRPARTVKEREAEQMLTNLVMHLVPDTELPEEPDTVPSPNTSSTPSA